MREHTIKLYQYEELSESEQAKARDWFCTEHNDDGNWSEATLEDAKL